MQRGGNTSGVVRSCRHTRRFERVLLDAGVFCGSLAGIGLRRATLLTCVCFVRVCETVCAFVAVQAACCDWLRRTAHCSMPYATTRAFKGTVCSEAGHFDCSIVMEVSGREHPHPTVTEPDRPAAILDLDQQPC